MDKKSLKSRTRESEQQLLVERRHEGTGHAHSTQDEIAAESDVASSHSSSAKISTFPSSNAHHRKGHTGQGNLTRPRQEALKSIGRMCQYFKIESPDMKAEMEALLEKTSFSPLEVAACAVFLIIVRQSCERQLLDEQISIQQVSSFSKIDSSLIHSALSSVEKILSLENKECARKGSAMGATTALPKFAVKDPIIPDKDATERIKLLAHDIIRVVLRISSQSLDPNFISVAACSLAYQSTFFPEKAKKMASLKEFVDIAGESKIFTTVQKSAKLIEVEFKQLTDKMLEKGLLEPKKRESFKCYLAKNLGKILEHEAEVCGEVLAESNAKRASEIDIYVPPKVLTKEEEAAYNATEVSDKDLPDDEFRSYQLNDEVRQFREQNLIPAMIQAEEEPAKRKQPNQGKGKRCRKISDAQENSHDDNENQIDGDVGQVTGEDQFDDTD